MKNQVVKTTVVFNETILETLEQLQAEDNSCIDDLCQECEKIARWFRQEWKFNSSMTPELVLSFNEVLDSVRDRFDGLRDRKSVV